MVEAGSSERGSATIIMAGIIGVIMIIFGTVITVVRLNFAVETAQTVADLSALGAANALHNQSRPPCPVASLVAQQNDPRALFQMECHETSQGNVSVCARGSYLVFPVRACGIAGPAP